MTTTFKVRRYGILAAAAVICVLAASVVAKATQTLTVPNSATYTYNLASGASTAPITPPSNQAVLLIGAQTAAGFRGVASATLLHVPGSFIEWNGIESPQPPDFTSGFSGAPGTHILYLDYYHYVDVQVAGTDTILIQNANPLQTATGSIELIW